jgi:glutamate--cysteine ligase
MTDSMAQRLAALGTERLRGMRRGIEKESLRVDTDGRLAMTPHPAALGSALTHPSITTDYSEAQLELITGVHDSVEACAGELMQIHQFVARVLGEERLWVASMPCRLPPDETIPIGRYGTSHIGRAKSVYRMGLGQRYGRRMQTICGIHYNWSLPGLSNDEYFALIRNFRRHSFVLLLLFGASPAVCDCFVEGRAHELASLGPDTRGLPHATSLRMGRLGYQSDAQAALAVSYNSLADYAGSLEGALTRPFPPYERLGIRNPGGDYVQLSTSLLQIENEFYGTIRPKRVIRRGERPLHALRERGVEYVEVRCLDLDPFEPVGIAMETMRVLDVFLLHCLLADSPPDSPGEIARLARNQHRTAAQGRDTALKLERDGGEVRVRDWAREVLQACTPIAEALDGAQGVSAHAQALSAVLATLDQPQRLPSARVLDALARDFGGSYLAFVRAQSASAHSLLLRTPLASEVRARFDVQARVSIDEQRRIEAADSGSFEDWRRGYLAPETLSI